MIFRFSPAEWRMAVRKPWKAASLMVWVCRLTPLFLARPLRDKVLNLAAFGGSLTLST
jgi:hypothetical protein